MFEDDYDDDFAEPLFANGHWIWNDKKNELEFIPDIQIMKVGKASAWAPATIDMDQIQFRDDLDLVEQVWVRKRILRKTTGADDVIMLQDVKDLVLYLAPDVLLSPRIINILHTSTCERFLRALILYCQYYLQVTEIMKTRWDEQQYKIPTSNSKAIEEIYEENLSDLRVIVAKEYCTIILGNYDFRRFHHMGKTKQSRSDSRKEAIITEAFIQLIVHIVWIALARPSNFIEIKIEINRLIRSKKFNIDERKLKWNARKELTPSQRQVFHGTCLTPSSLLYGHSPLFDQIKNDRKVDHRMLGLGVMKYKTLDYRLKIIEQYLTQPETKFANLSISLGIIGIKRNRFDTMLRDLAGPSSTDRDRSRRSTRSSRSSTGTKKAEKSASARSARGVYVLYPQISIPAKNSEAPSLGEFPSEVQPRLVRNTTQYRKWLARVTRRATRQKKVQTQNN